MQLVTFTIGGEEYGVEILHVREIIRPVEITRIPNAPAAIRGVINLRGRAVPVLALREQLGMPSQSEDGTRHIVIVESLGRTVGLIVDSVRAVIRIETSMIEPAPALALGAGGQYVRGIVRHRDGLVILLDLDRILALELTPASDARAAGAAV